MTYVIREIVIAGDIPEKSAVSSLRTIRIPYLINDGYQSEC